MNNANVVYEAPAIIEVGDFTDLTRLTSSGRWVDSPGWAWWL